MGVALHNYEARDGLCRMVSSPSVTRNVFSFLRRPTRTGLILNCFLVIEIPHHAGGISRLFYFTVPSIDITILPKTKYRDYPFPL